MNTCRSKANQLKLFVFLTIYESKSNNYQTLMHVTQIRQIKIRLINSKMAKYYSIFAPMLLDIRFNIRFEVEYFDLQPSFFCFAYYSTQVTEVCYSLRRRISKRDPASPIFGIHRVVHTLLRHMPVSESWEQHRTFYI